MIEKKHKQPYNIESFYDMAFKAFHSVRDLQETITKLEDSINRIENTIKQLSIMEAETAEMIDKIEREMKNHVNNIASDYGN